MLGVLLVVALAGCFGGPGSDKSNDDAQTADAVPTLPDDLTMDGAEVIHRTASSVTFRWEGTLPPTEEDATGSRMPSDLTTKFRVPGGLQLEVDAWMFWLEGIDADLFILDGTSDGELYQEPSPGVVGGSTYEAEVCQNHGNRASLGYKTCFYNVREPLHETEAWTVIVRGHDNEAAMPFNLTLRLETVSPYEVYALDRVEPIEVTVADGTVLRGHVYIPTGDGPFGTVLEYSPYWTTGWYGDTGEQRSHDRGRPTITFWLRAYLDAGFAVAMVSERGMGRSDGCWSVLDPQVGIDGAAVVEAIADQPWSNGKVAATGWSLPGGNAVRIAAEAPPSLAAIVPVSGHIDFWYHNFVIHGAPVFGPTLGAQFSVYFPAVGATVQPNAENLVHNARRAGCPDPFTIATEAFQPVWNGDKTEWWEARDLQDALGRADLPMLASVGMRLDLLRAADKFGPILNEDSIFLWGQWTHTYPTWYYEYDFEDLAVAFLDHHLRGGPKTFKSGVAHIQDDRRDWHGFDHWPPAADNLLHVSDGALVSSTDDVATSTHVFQSVDASPTLQVCSDHQVTFASGPLEEEIVLAGNVLVNLTLSSTLPDGNLVALLYRTPGDGSCGDPDAVQVARAASNLYHRGYLEVGRDFPIGTPDEVHLRSDPFAHVVPAGERLVLVVSGGDNVRCPGVAADPCAPFGDAIAGHGVECNAVSCPYPNPMKPEITIHTGRDLVAEVALPVIEGTLHMGGAAPPEAAPVRPGVLG